MTDSDRRIPVSDHARPGGVGRLGAHEVARIGYGAMQLQGFGRQVTHDEGVAIVRRALELGVDHVDTAQFYGGGRVNAILREALAGADGIVTVSKVGAVHDAAADVGLRVAQKPAELREQVLENLDTLGVERIDAVNLRRTDGGAGIVADGDQVVPIEDQLAELIALRDEGAIGAIGLSNVSLEQLRTALPAGIVCVQNAYNVLHRDDEPVLELCAAEGIAWVPFFPLGSAFDRMPSVTDRPEVEGIAKRIGATPSQVGLAWLLAHSPATLLIPGTASRDHLEENVAAGGIRLDADALAVLDGLAAAGGA